MKWIVITLPDFIENESTYINQLFKAGIDLLHLRKPESNIEECRQLLQCSTRNLSSMRQLRYRQEITRIKKRTRQWQEI